MNDDDAWDAFGSGSDDDSSGDGMEDGGNEEDSKGAPILDAANTIATHLVQLFMSQNPQIALSDRKVLVLIPAAGGRECHEYIAAALVTRNIKAYLQEADDDDAIDIPNVDAIVCIGFLGEKTEKLLLSSIQQILCPGGTLIMDMTLVAYHSLQDLLIPAGSTLPSTSVNGNLVGACQIKAVCVHSKNTCPWLPSSHSIKDEQERLQEATVAVSAQESISSRISQQSIKKAVHALQKCGYCILPGLLYKKDCHEWGQAVLESVHQAATILKERDNVDIYHPHSSQSEPQSYQELSMREDLRLDIRQGPALWKLRKEKGDRKGNESVVIQASDKDYSNGIFLRGHPSILEIIRQTMNPHDSQDRLWKGNMGRWNFGGSGADGSYQDLRLSPVGGIVSLPGAADQALHADTPHLFENFAKLPAHYINVFAPCTPFDEQVGGTAFIHGSHNLEFTAKYCGDDGMGGDNSKVYPFLVRPKLNMGDVILFDCRILHFGLANTSESVERCICYTNTWQNWFHDAKNWDQNRAIFDADGEKEEN